MGLLRSLSKDHYGAALLIALGAAVVVAGRGYSMGSLTAMGSGFFPVVLGVICVVLGVALGVSAGPPAKAAGEPPDLRGGVCILGGVASFVLFGAYGGLVPAIFASVFVSALGDRKNTVREAFLLACLMVVAGVLIFSVGLHLQMPLFGWS